MKTLVFDVDDVICVHKDRDYENAKPMTKVIEKINYMHYLGYYIKLYTARGQHSCKGNLNLIIERNEKTLTDWLKKHNVLYDELIFGKPLGDWYIDDKALSLNDFMKAKFVELKGGSGSEIIREHNKVIKKCKNAKEQYEWYKIAKEFGLNIPKISSLVVDTIYMEYIKGDLVCNILSKDILKKVYDIINDFRYKNDKNEDLLAYKINLLKHIPNNKIVNNVISLLNKHSKDLIAKVSFSHGDMTLSNMIYKDEKVYLIDPNYKNDYSSYLLDLAKVRQSLNDYEYMFGISDKKNSYFLNYFDELLGDNLFLVKLLEITHWIRMYNYKEDKEIVMNMIEKLYGELYEK